LKELLGLADHEHGRGDRGQEEQVLQRQRFCLKNVLQRWEVDHGQLAKQGQSHGHAEVPKKEKKNFSSNNETTQQSSKQWWSINIK